MKRRRSMASIGGVALAVLIAGTVCRSNTAPAREMTGPKDIITLPVPVLDGEASLEAAIAGRRSVDAFAPTELTMAEIGQLAWAAQGITDAETGHRACPSAGAMYPLELYFLTRQALLHYIPDGHRMERVLDEDPRPRLQDTELRSRQIAGAPLVILVAAEYERTAARFGERATRYAHIEAGHAGQNIQLQAVALGLASTPIGASDDGRARKALGLPEEEIVYVLCVGHAG